MLAVFQSLAIGLALVAIPVTNCTCLLEMTQLGPAAGKFVVTFDANPNPQPGQGQGDGACTAECTPAIATQGCRVNGTLHITNNSPYSVVVNWAGQVGGTPVASNGGTGDFATGFKGILCGDSASILFNAGANGAVCTIKWNCNSCAVPPAPPGE